MPLPSVMTVACCKVSLSAGRAVVVPTTPSWVLPSTSSTSPTTSCSGPRRCTVCAKLLSSKYALQVHMRDVHCGARRTYACSLCNKVYASQNSYRVHVSLKHRHLNNSSSMLSPGGGTAYFHEGPAPHCSTVSNLPAKSGIPITGMNQGLVGHSLSSSFDQAPFFSPQNNVIKGLPIEPDAIKEFSGSAVLARRVCHSSVSPRDHAVKYSPVGVPPEKCSMASHYSDSGNMLVSSPPYEHHGRRHSASPCFVEIDRLVDAAIVDTHGIVPQPKQQLQTHCILAPATLAYTSPTVAVQRSSSIHKFQPFSAIDFGECNLNQR